MVLVSNTWHNIYVTICWQMKTTLWYTWYDVIYIHNVQKEELHVLVTHKPQALHIKTSFSASTFTRSGNCCLWKEMNNDGIVCVAISCCHSLKSENENHKEDKGIV